MIQWFHRQSVSISLILGLWAIVAVWVEAANRTVVLSVEQETALLAATEEANARRAGEKDANGNPLPVLTVDEVLAQIVAADLVNGLRNLDATIMPVLENLKALDAATLAKVLTTVQSQATKERLQQNLAP